MHLAVVPLKFGSRRMKLKNVTPVAETLTPSFVHVVRTLLQVDGVKVYLVVEEGYLEFVKKFIKHYRASDLLVVEAPAPIHKEGSTVRDVVRYAMDLEADLGKYKSLLVAYPTAFNLTKKDILELINSDEPRYSVMDNGDDAGCIYNMPNKNNCLFEDYYVSGVSSPVYLGDHLIDINTEEDFREAEEIHRRMLIEGYF